MAKLGAVQAGSKPRLKGNAVDTKKRSMMKSLTWRIFGIFLLAAITYFSTNGNLKEMTIITVLFHGIRFVLYYFHERWWEKIQWGRIKHPLADLPVKGELSPADLDAVREKLRALGYVE